jgi:uncharacterized repeat protein (TIGR01451 family)
LNQSLAAIRIVEEATMDTDFPYQSVFGPVKKRKERRLGRFSGGSLGRTLTLAATSALVIVLAVIPASANPAPGPSSGNSVQPIEKPGNPSCTDLLAVTDFLFEFKLEPVASGTFPLSFDGLSGSVTVTVNNTAQGQTFDFSFSGDFVAAGVIVKGGPNANFYDYRPDGEDADTALHAPVNPNNNKFFGLSHISFCITEAQAELQITKTAVDDVITVGDKASFSITVTNLGPATAQDVTIDDELPNTVLDWVENPNETECTINGTDTGTGNTLHCDVGDLAANASFTVTIETTEAIALGSELCNADLDNEALAEAGNADQVSALATIRVECGAIEINKVRKVPGSETTQPLEGAGFTLFEGHDAPDDGSEVAVGAEVLTDTNGIACFDGLPTNSDFTARETTTPAGFATADDTNVSTAGEADCASVAGDPVEVTVENAPLTDVSIDVTAQIPGATQSTIECEGKSSGAPSDPASLDIEDLVPGTYTCTIVIDP